MKKILFLDFDGVLHSKTDQRYARLGLLEQFLLRMPELEIVVSSSVRENYSFERLQKIFSPELQHRVVGVTPVLSGWFDVAGRQREVEAYLKSHDLNADNARWVALDDIKYYFEDGCSNLILVDGHRGFTEQEGELLLAWYGQEH